MKRAALYAILALMTTLTAGLPATASTPQEAAAATGPQAVVEEAIHEAGTVVRGRDIVHDFVIRNQGDAPLNITDVRPACGCTVADYDETIPAGGSGKVHAVLTTDDQMGPISKGITVLTDDADNPRLVLTIKATVDALVFTKPGFARFVKTQHSEPGKVSQLIFTKNFENLEVVAADSPYPFLDVDVRPATKEERHEDGVGKQWVAEITLDYQSAPIGALAEYVRFELNHPEQKVVTVPVSGFVRPMVVVTPKEADFDEVEVAPDGGTFGTMLLKSYAEQDLDLKVESVTVPGVEVSLKESEPGREFVVTVTLNEELPEGPFDGTIRLQTGHPNNPVVEIPLKGRRL